MTPPHPAHWKVTFTQFCSSIPHSLLAGSGFPHLQQKQLRRDLCDPTTVSPWYPGGFFQSSCCSKSISERASSEPPTLPREQRFYNSIKY